MFVLSALPIPAVALAACPCGPDCPCPDCPCDNGRAHLGYGGYGESDLDRDASCKLQALLSRLADGDRSACDPTFELSWPLVSRFAERALAGAPEAEDAAQD